MKNENDLRVIKTRKNIIDSFLALHAEKPLNEISVTEICRAAFCSRNTFYFHFDSKEALYEAIVGQYVEQIYSGFSPEANVGECYKDYALRKTREIGFAVLSVREELLSLLRDDQRSVFFDLLQNVIYDSLLKGARSFWTEIPVTSKEFYLSFWYGAGAITGFLKGCLSDMKISVSEAVDALSELHIPLFAATARYADKERQLIAVPRTSSKV